MHLFCVEPKVLGDPGRSANREHSTLRSSLQTVLLVQVEYVQGTNLWCAQSPIGPERRIMSRQHLADVCDLASKSGTPSPPPKGAGSRY
jgi:hypothetical protein